MMNGVVWGLWMVKMWNGMRWSIENGLKVEVNEMNTSECETQRILGDQVDIF